MPFENGNQLYKERVNSNRAGRPKIKVIADRALATKLAEERLAKSFGDLIKHGIKVALKGIKTKRFYPKDHPQAGKVYYEYIPDMATWRFIVERFLPPAKQTIDLNLKSGFEKLIQDLESEELAEKERIEQARLVSPPDEEWK